MSWFDAARLIPVRAVAEALGLQVGRDGFRPCPACGAERRGRTDRRAPVGLRNGWKCHACGEQGDGLQLAARIITGEPRPSDTGDGWGPVRAFYAAKGWCSPASDGAGFDPSTYTPPRKADRDPADVRATAPKVGDRVSVVVGFAARKGDACVVRELRGRGSRGEIVAVVEYADSERQSWPVNALEVLPEKAQPAVPTEPPQRLDPAEVAGLWEAACPVSSSDAVRSWLLERASRWGETARDGVVERVERLELVRAIPDDVGRLPSWAAIARPWSETGHRVLLPIWGPGGDLVALRARNVTGDDPKEVSPRGTGCTRGTVYADPVGRWLLQGGRSPGEAIAGHPGATWSGVVLVAEGGPSWLYLAAHPSRLASIHPSDAERQLAELKGEPSPVVRWSLTGSRAAVLGVWSGAWPDDDSGDKLAACLARASLVVIATDEDNNGDSYARNIGATLDRVGVPWQRVK